MSTARSPPSLLVLPGGPPFPAKAVYIGSGDRNACLPPSPWCNVFLDTAEDEEALDLCYSYAADRADCVTWLAPLLGKQVFAVSPRDACHFSVLLRLAEETFILDSPIFERCVKKNSGLLLLSSS